MWIEKCGTEDFSASAFDNPRVRRDLVLRKTACLNPADDPVFNKDIRLGRRGGFSGNKDSAEQKSGHGGAQRRGVYRRQGSTPCREQTQGATLRCWRSEIARCLINKDTEGKSEEVTEEAHCLWR